MTVRLLGIIDWWYEIWPVITTSQQYAIGRKKCQPFSTFHNQDTKHLTVVCVTAYFLMGCNILLHLCCCLTAQRIWLVTERIGKPHWSLVIAMEWMYVHLVGFAKIQKSTNMTKNIL
jgi:hypothetical protein